MSDDLDQLLRESLRDRRTAGNPRLRVGPLLKGMPLDGGPTLEESPAAAPAATTVSRPASSLRPAAAPRLIVPLPRGEEPAVPALSEPPKQSPPPAFVNAGYRLMAIGLHKSYHKGPVEVPVLGGVHIGVREGELLAIVGQSGSGKSTLLHLLGTLDVPDRGEVHFEGNRIDNLPPAGRDILRNRHFGMIFQFYHLLPELTALENVLAPLMIAQGAWQFFRHRHEHRARATELLETVGLGHRLKHRPRELSGGEMQRAAIARALVAQPDLLLADEPTGNLDQNTGREIIRILRDLNDRQNLTIVMVTHDQAIAAQADRTVRLVGGRVEE
jgi:lipoprotein-releasing system ATP-binding protein